MKLAMAAEAYGRRNMTASIARGRMVDTLTCAERNHLITYLSFPLARTLPARHDADVMHTGTTAHKTVMVALNECGKRIGETHQNAKLTDAMVESIRDLHEYENQGYTQIARSLGMSYNTIKKICTYERRAQRPERWKRVAVKS